MIKLTLLCNFYCSNKFPFTKATITYLIGSVLECALWDYVIVKTALN